MESSDNKIIHSKELQQAVIDFYQHKLESYDLADIYFKNQLYSAATTYYIQCINELYNCDEFSYDIKAYCLYHVALCCYYQKYDFGHLGEWQWQTITQLCKESLTYDKTNFAPYMLLGYFYKDFCNNEINEYYIYQDLFVNINKIKIDKEYKDDFMNIIIRYIDIYTNMCKVKYDKLFKKIFNYMNNSDIFTTKDLQLVIDKYNSVMDNISEGELYIM